MFDLRAVNAGGTFNIRQLTPNAQGQKGLGGFGLGGMRVVWLGGGWRKAPGGWTQSKTLRVGGAREGGVRTVQVLAGTPGQSSRRDDCRF